MSFSKVMKDLFKEADKWVPKNRARLDFQFTMIDEAMAPSGPLSRGIVVPLDFLGFFHSMEAVAAAAKGDQEGMVRFIGQSYAYQQLSRRIAYTVPELDAGSMSDKVTLALAQTVSFGQWETAEMIFDAALVASRKEAETAPGSWIQGYGGPQHSSFMLALYADAFGKTLDAPRTQGAEYGAFLAAWKGADPAAFAAPIPAIVAMREDNMANPPEDVPSFKPIDIVCPWELMAPLALRAKLGLPGMSTGDERIDTLYGQMQSLKWTQTDLQNRIEARAKKDYPHFR